MAKVTTAIRWWIFVRLTDVGWWVCPEPHKSRLQNAMKDITPVWMGMTGGRADG